MLRSHHRFRSLRDATYSFHSTHYAELAEVRAQCVDGLCALTDEEIAHAVLHELCLLLRSLYRHSADCRTLDRLTARRSIDRIVLVALDIGLHILGRHQPHIVPELLELARPIMGRRTRFHTD